MGLGVDRVLQFKVVTPDGKYRTVNKCQNTDLFFALRGGGGGTFGVVLESTILASPQVTLQAVILSFDANATLTKQLWTILVDNGIQWANDSWSGLADQKTAIYITPKLSKDEATQSMAPLIQFGQGLVDAKAAGVNFLVTTFPSYSAFFQVFTSSEVAPVGYNLALTSRLIPRTSFNNATSRSSLVTAFTTANNLLPSFLILIVAPSSFPGDGMTSVTDAWRSSIYHVTVAVSWSWNATIEDKKAQYSLASSAMDDLRKLTPDAAYVNEADVYEPNHQVAFWGDHYSRLLQIKQKYDPRQLLDCWHCVGSNPDSPRFACYL
jgi:FAD/FMN-containing dehydrogenase